MSTPIRVGTCSWADESLSKHWYPPGTKPGERLPYYAEHFDTVEVDSTYYRLPDEEMVVALGERTPDDFVMHVKAFGVMTRHPVKVEQLPPDLRDEAPLDERGRVDRPPREFRAEVFRRFHDALEPLRASGQARRHPLPAPAVHRLQAELARVPRVGEGAARRRRDDGRVPARELARRRAPRRNARVPATGSARRT